MQKISSQFKVSNVRPNLYNISGVEMGGKESVSSTLRTMVLEEKAKSDLELPQPFAKRTREPEEITPSEPLVIYPEPAIRKKLIEEKKDLLKVLEDLEEVRLNLQNSEGQGFLINASATISAFIRNNYNHISS